MRNSNGNALIATILVTACMLIVGGLVAWGAGAFENDPAPETMPPPAANGAHGAMNLPAGHPSIDGMTMSPGPIRADAPSGACPVSAPAAAAKSGDGCSCCPSGAAPAAEKAAAADSCCPEPEKKKECSGEECPGDGSCEECQSAKAN